ncbi:MAG TPA: DUF4398 domain-containing protein [Burkholderiales bacterium]|jgi:hypothetical protein|nr:DUF4398 domain-containing protein [Burkholderiales bacterium]
MPLLFLCALAACATTEPPEKEMAQARAALAQARPVVQQEGLNEYAQAHAKLERAERAMQQRHYEHARLLAEEAEADARLAWATSENARVKRALDAERASR